MIALPPSSEHKHIPQLCDSKFDPSSVGGELCVWVGVRVLWRLFGEFSGVGVWLGDRGEPESVSAIGDILNWSGSHHRVLH